MVGNIAMSDSLNYQEFLDAIGSDEMADPDVATLRFQACLGCELFDKEFRACMECGCYMPVKTKLKTAECPIGKW